MNKEINCIKNITYASSSIFNRHEEFLYVYCQLKKSKKNKSQLVGYDEFQESVLGY